MKLQCGPGKATLVLNGAVAVLVLLVLLGQFGMLAMLAMPVLFFMQWRTWRRMWSGELEIDNGTCTIRKNRGGVFVATSGWVSPFMSVLPARELHGPRTLYAVVEPGSNHPSDYRSLLTLMKLGPRDD